MYKNVLQSIEGVEIYPIISLLVFVVFFAGLLVWVLRVDKSYIKEMELLPLEEKEKRGENYE
jgi:cytochrome c oxidase cbb3-type subunit IV